MSISEFTINMKMQLRATVALLLVGLIMTAAGPHVYAAQDNGESNSAEIMNMVMNLSGETADEENLVSMEISDFQLSEALQLLAQEANVGISYNSDIIPDNKVTLIMNDVPVHEVLYMLLDGTNLESILPPSRDVIVIREREEVSVEMLQETVNGRVIDATTGEALPGVNIVVEGTNLGTATDFEGNFELEVPSLNETLIVTYIGYQRLEVPINGREEIDVEMRRLAIEGEEMVVTAFGIQREAKSLTYSTQGVNVTQLTEARELNVMESLQGKVAGLTINSTASGVGSATRVVLRGNRSISGSSQPLYVLDGVPIRGNPQDINPEDIASIDVLKGPNAAALYGSAAQNGAIVISTKRAQEGQVNVSLSNTFMFEDPILTIPFQNEYGQGSGGIYSPSSEFSWGPRMEGQQVPFWSPNPNHELYGQTVSLTPQPNNVSDVFQRGYNNSTNLTASLGGQRTHTTFSYTFTNADGMVPGNALARQNISVSVGSEISDRLSLDSRLSFMQQTIDNQVSTGEGFTNPMRNAYRIPRNMQTEHFRDFEYVDPDGINRQHYFNPGSNGGNNPYWVMNRRQSENTRERILGMASLRYDFTEMLSLMVRGSYDGAFNDSDVKTWVDSYVTADQGLYAVSKSETQEWNGDFLLSAARDLTEDFDFDVNFGGSIQQLRNSGISSNTNRDVGLTVPNLFALSNTQNVLVSHNVGSPMDVQSLYSFGEISFRNSIFLNLSGRNDWSSTLPEGDRSYFYPSVGVSAVLTDLVSGFPERISFARVRFSWAKVGNSAPAFSLTRAANVTAGGKSGYLSLSNTLPNTDLRPEETVSREVGIDLRLFEGRLGLDVTGYVMNTENQLFTVALPIGSGAGQFFTNGGDVENKGIEALLSTRPVQTTNVRWDVDLNFGLNRNMVVAISDERPRVQIASNFIRDHVIEEGQPFGNIYSRDILRNAQDQVLIDSNGLPLLSPGKTELVANYNPDWTGGISSSISYGNLNASFLIDHRQGGTVISQSDAIIFADGVTKQTLEGRDGGLIFGDNFFANETAVMEVGGAPNTTATDAESFWRHVGGRNAPVGGVFVESATNTRVREMTLGYNLSESVLAGLPVSNAKVSLVGRNLFFIYKASENNDPDILTGTGESSEGLNAFALPTARTFGVNVKLDF